MTKNRLKMSTRKSAVSMQNHGFGDLPSSRTASHRKTVHFEIVNVFGALTGTRFVPIFAPNMSGMILAVNFLTPPPRTSRETPHESCVMMHHGWSCIIHDHEHASVMMMNHCESSMILHHHAPWIMIHHGSPCIMHDHSSPPTRGSP